MKEMVLLGDEALALGLIHAGVSGCFGYPGTPSTEILEYLIDNYEKKSQAADTQEKAPLAQWCSNEKTAYEAALGVSFSGKRAVVTMKHVGLNVAADPFMNSALCKIKGGLICIVADDPSMHSSQGEQDTRFYADFAMIPLFEPTNQQEAYEMAAEAFEISERFNVPVIIRMVTRLAHSRAVVKTNEKNTSQNKLKKGAAQNWMLLPALARKNYVSLIEKQEGLLEWANGNSRNTLSLNPGRKDMAVITSGLGRNYYEENLKDFAEKSGEKGLPSSLHISGMPLPVKLIQEIAGSAETIVVIEEGMPFIEKQLRGIIPGKNKIRGKYDGFLPRTGELSPDSVRAALGLSPRKTAADEIQMPPLPGRPPQLCKGCPHHDSYTAINKAVAILNEKDRKNGLLSDGEVSTVVTSDIGCYSLGASAPLKSIESIVCMGASVGMARGASIAGYRYTFGVIGDSTFMHSGLTGLVDAVASKTPVTIVILDNSIVGMTGCQPTIIPSSKFEQVVKGLGVEPEHVRTLLSNPGNIDANAGVLVEEAEYRGVSVVILARECLEAFRLRKKKEAIMNNKKAEEKTE